MCRRCRARRARMAAVASKPSISGICTSMKIASNGSRSPAPRPPRGRCRPTVDAMARACRAGATASRWLTALSSASSTRSGSARWPASTALGRRGTRVAAGRPARLRRPAATRCRERERAAAADARSSTPIRPPISATSCAEIARPRPVPPYLRVVEPSACANASKIAACLLGRDADAGVGHREAQLPTSAAAPIGSRASTSTVTSPRSVNLTALPTRFSEHLAQPLGVADDASGTSGGDARRAAPGPSRARAQPSSCERLADAARAGRTAAALSSSLPASIFEKSRMSLMTRSSASADAWTISRYSRCSRSCGVSSSSSVMPRTPFIGVRISWLMLARNSLFARLAASATSFAATSCQVCCRTRRLRVATQAIDTAVATPSSASVQSSRAPVSHGAASRTWIASADGRRRLKLRGAASPRTGGCSDAMPMSSSRLPACSGPSRGVSALWARRAENVAPPPSSTSRSSSDVLRCCRRRPRTRTSVACLCLRSRSSADASAGCGSGARPTRADDGVVEARAQGCLCAVLAGARGSPPLRQNRPSAAVIAAPTG